MRYDWTSLAIVCGIGLVVAGLVVRHTVQAERRLRRWADDNGLTILKMRRAIFFHGPFPWLTTRDDYIYRLTLRNPEGEVLAGWARIPVLVAGLYWGSVEAKWDDRTPAPAPPRD